MAVMFSADEVFEMAEQIERNGAKFYRKAAQGFSDPGIKQMLEELAAMEVEHQQTFSAMRSELPAAAQPTVFDPDNETGLYLRAMADGHIIDVKTDPAEQLKGNETPCDILTTAIGMEKDSVMYYLGLAAFVAAQVGKDKVNNIIKEEMKHITLLVNKRASIT